MPPRGKRPDGSTLEAEVSQRLKKIIPPKSMKSAQALAKAGNLVVPLLAYDRQRNAPAVAASARTLALVSTPESLAALFDYMADNRAAVIGQCEKWRIHISSATSAVWRVTARRSLSGTLCRSIDSKTRLFSRICG